MLHPALRLASINAFKSTPKADKGPRKTKFHFLPPLVFETVTPSGEGGSPPEGCPFEVASNGARFVRRQYVVYPGGQSAVIWRPLTPPVLIPFGPNLMRRPSPIPLLCKYLHLFTKHYYTLSSTIH